VLQLDDATYRAMLARLCNGKTSSTQLNATERKAVLAHMKASGFVVKPKAKAAQAEEGWQRAPQMRKLRAMWYVLADAGHVERPADTDACNASVQAWAVRQLSGSKHPLETLRFATGLQMSELVEGLKAWCDRVGLGGLDDVPAIAAAGAPGAPAKAPTATA
jgi:phage gp16-like protein